MSHDVTDLGTRAVADFHKTYSEAKAGDLEARASTYSATALVIIAWSIMLTLFFSIALTVTIVARPDNRGLAASMDESRQEIEVLGISAYISYGQLAFAAGAAFVASLLVWRIVLSSVRSD